MSHRRVLIWGRDVVGRRGRIARAGDNADRDRDGARTRRGHRCKRCRQDEAWGDSGTVVWLTAITTTGAGSEATTATSPPASPAQNPRLVQKNKSFEPHILVVPAGSMVEFPNHDPFFHNVFSLFEGKRFDLVCTKRAPRGWCDSTGLESATFLQHSSRDERGCDYDGDAALCRFQPGRAT